MIKRDGKTNGILGFLIELYFYDLFMQIIFTRTSLCVYEPISLQPSFDFISFDIVITRFCYTCFYLKVQSSRKTEITSVLQLYMAPDCIELTQERGVEWRRERWRERGGGREKFDQDFAKHFM